MSKIVVIGATGHIGTFLVLRLAMAGHHIIAVSRGVAQPYLANLVWPQVEILQIDPQAEESRNNFGTTIANLNADIVIYLICFTHAISDQLADALEGKVGHLIHIGTIWTHGISAAVPAPESAVKFPFGDYGAQKADIEANLLLRAHRRNFPISIVHHVHADDAAQAIIPSPLHL
ncbi:MAG: NmrA family NAD(P)-binding protein, partial [Candidatus Devosia euplotis]|nr:NmrA family NAD(P)-binding protein [Candidatus Devosia euplotis]